MLDSWEFGQRRVLGLVSQLDLFSATVAELTAVELLDEEWLVQVMMFMSRPIQLAVISSSEKLLSAPLSTPLLFGGIIGEVLASDKEDQFHASMANSRPSQPANLNRKRTQLSYSFTGPPIKKEILRQQIFRFEPSRPIVSRGSQMETTSSIRASIQPGDWAVSMDLADA